MSDFLHNLRNKPANVRERIAIGITAGMTVLIIGIWLGTNKALTFSTPEATSPQVSAPGPFDTLKKSFSQFSDNFSKNVDDLKTKFGTTSNIEAIPATSTEEAN
jgi:hypothetical protein